MNQILKFSDQENLFGVTEKNQCTFLIDMFIIITKLIINQRRPEGLRINICDILRSIQNEMLADEYDWEMNQRVDIFNKRWGLCVGILRTKQ